MSEIDIELRNIHRQTGFIRGLILAAALARRNGHIALSDKLFQIGMCDGLVHLEPDAALALAEKINA